MKLGNIEIDKYDLSSAVCKIAELIRARHGIVFTPNVDHIILSIQNKEFGEAYKRATLKLADGMPIVWASKLLGANLPERVAGSDLFPLILDMANDNGYFVYFLGSTLDVLKLAAKKAEEQFPGIVISGLSSPQLSENPSREEIEKILEPIKNKMSDVIFVAFGAPKQEIFISKAHELYPNVVFIGVGASIDFFAGKIKRAPIWMQKSGLEWAYRLYKEPRRMWKRYLRDLQFPFIVAKELMRTK